MSEPAGESRAEVYTWAWLTGMDGDISIGDRPASVSASFIGVPDASDAIFAPSGRVKVGRGRIGGFLDGMYANVRADDQTGSLGVVRVALTTAQIARLAGAGTRRHPVPISARRGGVVRASASHSMRVHLIRTALQAGSCRFESGPLHSVQRPVGTVD